MTTGRFEVTQAFESRAVLTFEDEEFIVSRLPDELLRLIAAAPEMAELLEAWARAPRRPPYSETHALLARIRGDETP